MFCAFRNDYAFLTTRANRLRRSRVSRSYKPEKKNLFLRKVKQTDKKKKPNTRRRRRPSNDIRRVIMIIGLRPAAGRGETIRLEISVEKYVTRHDVYVIIIFLI